MCYCEANSLSEKYFRAPLLGLAFLILAATAAQAQRAETVQPLTVQPGAPGTPTRVMPSNTRPKLLAVSAADVEFMQGMIMHHGQAVEMTALIDARTQNKELRLLGARISHSQADEINFMKRWLVARGEPTAMQTKMPMKDMGMSGMDMAGMDMSGGDHEMLMPGMLTKKQMAALRDAKGSQFDRLFLSGMIQHHKGALVMVEKLFASPGAGQDSELFEFTTDVDSGQRAEIRIMEGLLDRKQ